LNSNKRRSLYTSDNTKEGASSDDDDDKSTRISAPLDIAMDDEEKRIVTNQLQQRCISTYQKSGLLTLKPVEDVVSTRLANLKERCQLLLINYLTM
jgi:hypothetical protein